MSFFGKLLALFSRAKANKPAALTAADVRRARLQLEQIQQRIERSAEDLRRQRGELFTAGQAARDPAGKVSAARKVKELDSLLAGWEHELADVARRRQVLAEAEIALTRQAMTSETPLELKSLDDLDRFIEDVAVERQVQSAKAARILSKVAAVKDVASAPSATTDAETASLVAQMSAPAAARAPEKTAPAEAIPAPPARTEEPPAAEEPPPVRETESAIQPPRELVDEDELD